MWDPMLMKVKKSFKNLKIENLEKNKKMWRYCASHKNLAWIHAAVSEKPELMDRRQTGDHGRQMLAQ